MGWLLERMKYLLFNYFLTPTALVSEVKNSFIVLNENTMEHIRDLSLNRHCRLCRYRLQGRLDDETLHLNFSLAFLQPDL